ncbi:MAG: sel1 repeat family protein [Deltaproteobacteria bacterium]|jgi:TPR repeat protein|nr:sel1 repeat family protein [Deltaproteobacteria bacterium]
MRRCNRILVILCLALPVVLSGCAFLSGPTLSERTEQSGLLYGQGRDAAIGTPVQGGELRPDYKAAAGYYERSARNGSAEGAYALAALYRDGLVSEKTEEATKAAAFFWMREAAVGGWPQAQYELAVFYYEGKGVEPDPAASLSWLEKAAANNNVLAQRFLGELYLNGASADGKLSLRPDVKKGAAWYLRAAYNDDGPSQAVMGALYMTGRGIEKDSVQAIKWNKLAAGKGFAGAQKRLSTLYSDQKRKSGYEQAIIQHSDDFSRGDPQAGYLLGRIYYYGPAPYNNAWQAVKLFRTTADKVAASALMLGVAAEEGKGLPQDFADAVNWYQKAAAMGRHEAYAYLGAAYLDGRGVPADESEAAAMFQAGADKGDPRSQRRLALLYTQGRGLPYDYEKALHWCREAAKGGDVQAMCLTGAMYEKGVGTSRNVDEAKHWYRRAVDSLAEDEAVRQESVDSWKRDAREGLARLDAEAAAAPQAEDPKTAAPKGEDGA